MLLLADEREPWLLKCATNLSVHARPDAVVAYLTMPALDRHADAMVAIAGGAAAPRNGAAAFDGVDRHGRISPDGSEMRGDSIENKQVELIMSDRWFR